MGKVRRWARRGSRAPEVLKQRRELRVVAEAAAADPTGSCRYADGLGQMQCESPVPKSYCDGKGGFFTPDGRC